MKKKNLSVLSVGPLLLMVLLSLGASEALASTPDHRQAVVSKIDGAAWAVTDDGRRRELRQNMIVFASETVETGDGSTITVKFTDGSRFELGANAAMLVKDYVFKPRDPESRLVTRIIRGTFRFVSGIIARARGKKMRVELPVGVIGIRGTQVMGEADATSATVILLQPEDDPDRYTAIEVSNQFGSVVVDRPGWGTEIPDELSPPSPPRRMQLDTLNRLNRSMQTIRRVITPRVRPGM